MTQTTDSFHYEEPGQNREYNLDILKPLEPSKLPDRWFKVDRYGESVAMYRVGNVAYPMVTVQACHTCTHAFRVDIENAVIEGYGYEAISRSLPEGSKELSGRRIYEHKSRGHMPIDQLMVRQIQEARAAQIGLDIMTGSTLIDYITLGLTVVTKTYQKVVRGEIEPDLKDALGFSRLIHQVEVMAGNDIDHEIIYQVLVEWQDMVKLLTDEETYRLIAEGISNSPVLREMIERKSREEILVGFSEGDEGDSSLALSGP